MASGTRTPTRGERPDLNFGDRVVVSEPGIPAWEGDVLSVKPGIAHWRIEVRNDEHVAWTVPSEYVRRAA